MRRAASGKPGELIQKAVAEAIKRLGAHEVAHRLDVSFESALRLGSGQPVRRVTERLARANLAALQARRSRT